MCLSVNGDHLITGDCEGVIYIWHLKDGNQGQGVQSQQAPRLTTFEIHKDKGSINNLVAINRPLSLFGLTANMQGYEPGEFKPLNRQIQSMSGSDADKTASTTTVILPQIS